MTRRRPAGLSPDREGAPTTGRGFLEKALRAGLFGCLGLLLLTPFVISPETVFPFVVGKALWSRTLIEVAFALWAALALWKPEYRPPRSRLLALLAAGLGVALLASWFGVSFQRSLWSTYERMQGVFDLAHWFVLVLVLASSVRTRGEWRKLLQFNLAAAAAMACLVIARSLQFEIPLYGSLPEPSLPRFGGPLGNPLYLSAYLLVNLFVALGFAARSFLSSRRSRAGPGWLVVAALLSWGMLLAGSVGAFLGLFGSLGFLAAAWVLLSRGGWRRAAVSTAVGLGAAAIVLGALFFGPARTGSPEGEVMRLEVAKFQFQHPTVQGRLAAWETGVRGFGERPLLGWGSENFDTVFGRFASGYAATMEPHDHAHGKFIEVAATTGAAGLAVWLALWAATFLAVLRAARRTDRREKALAVFVGAALAGYFVVTQSLFDTTAGLLQHTLLLAFVVSLEHPAPTAGGSPRARGPWLAWRWARGGAMILALGVSGAGLASNRAIHRASREVYRAAAAPEEFDLHLERAIETFAPLANLPRVMLFDTVARNWEELRRRQPEEAMRLLTLADAEAVAALDAEPENWRLQHSLARLDAAVAATEPEYAGRAGRRLERARRSAPARAVFPRPPENPVAVEARRLEAGGIELRWRPAEGVGYHEVSERREDGNRTLLYSYDASRASFVLPAPPGPVPVRYAVRACYYPSPAACSEWTEWPEVAVPAAAGGSEPR